MSLITAIFDFFAALRGPDPDIDIDIDNDITYSSSSSSPTAVPVNTGICNLHATNAAQRARISRLELDLLYFSKRNTLLHASAQATENDIVETLAIADKLVKPRQGYHFVPAGFVDEKVRKAVAECEAQYMGIVREKDSRLEADARAWQGTFKQLQEQVLMLARGLQVKIQEVEGAAVESASEVERLGRENAALKEALRSALEDRARDMAVLAKLELGMEDWKMDVKREAWAWQTGFMEKVRREQAEKCKEEHGEQVQKLVRERDCAVEANKRLEGEIENLEMDLEGEQFLHRVAISVTQRLQGELEDEEDNYELLRNEFLRVSEAAGQSEDAYRDLSGAHTATLWEMHQLQEENARASTEAKQAYVLLAAAHFRALKAVQDSKVQADETQTRFGELGNQLQTVKAGVSALKEQRDRFRTRGQALEERLLRLKAHRDDMVERLMVALKQKGEALRGQLEALKMVQKLKNGEVLDDGKEILVLDEDEDVVSEAAEEPNLGGQEVEVLEAVGLGTNEPGEDEEDQEDCGNELEEATLVGSEDEEDEGHADDECEEMSEGDANDVEQWQL